MHPTDPSDTHLSDRAIELRVLKSGVVVFTVTLTAFFYPIATVFGVFALVYVAYKFYYYRERIGVFDSDDLSIRHRKLELGLLAIGVVTLVSLVAIRTVFSDSWALGGFLSLPPIDFTDFEALLDNTLVPLAWMIVVAPVVAVSYAGFQFRHRLLAGLDSYEAAIRAAVWESLARLPVYLLWIAFLTTRPVYEVYEPVVRLIGTSVGLTVGTTSEFATVLGSAFTHVVVVGFASSATVIGTFVVVQRWKYGDATIPEVFGYHGVAPPSQSSHPANVAVPIAVYLLYTLAVFVVVSSLPLGDLGLVFAVAVSVLVGANFLGKTTILVRSVSERVADSFDGFVTGLLVGVVSLGVFSVLLGSSRTFTELALTYPILAIPLTELANRAAGTYAVNDISEFLDRIDSGTGASDREAVDRLFVYSRAWDDTLRATATDGLANLVQVTSYRRDDALDVFVGAIGSDQDRIVHSGLRGIAAILDKDPTTGTYERLADAGCREQIVFHLDSNDEAIQARATEVAARLFTFDLDATDPTPHDYPTEARIDSMIDVVSNQPEDRELAGAVVEYFSTVWYVTGRLEENGMEPTDPGAQKLLGELIRLSERVDEDGRLSAVLAVTADRTPADDERFSLAIDHLDSEVDEVRFMAIHVVRSSMDRRTDWIDTQQLVDLLEDPSETVRRAGARTIATFVQFAPDRAPQLLDRLVLHLEESRKAPGLTEASVIRALGAIDEERLIDHPTAASTIAGYVDGTSRAIAGPAAEVLSSLVRTDPVVARQDAVGAAIEAGLTHPDFDVRLHCLEAVVAVIDGSVEEGRRFVRGLGANLDTREKHSELSAVCLAELIEAFPEDGLDILPGLAKGLGNLTSIHRQAAPFVVRGTTVSEVTVDILAEVVPLDPGRGEVLIEPLTDFATSADGVTLKRVFEVLAELSAEFPAECRAAVGTAVAVIDDGRPEVRRDATEMLANVAAYHPETVEPFADRIVIATDDDSPRIRAAALVVLRNVCTASPAAIDADIHRVVGLLDDDSASVRKAAADLIVTIAERKPGIVEPAAETADRLRRLQRDPAVDFDAARLQDASTAIQTGVPIEEGEATEEGQGEGEGGDEIWSPETSDEMGASGDTNVFEPVGDEFDSGFDDAFDDEFGEPDTTEETSDVSNAETPVAGGEKTAEPEGSSEPPEGVEDLETVVESSETGPDAGRPSEDSGVDVGDLETAIEPSRDRETSDGEDSSDDVEGLETTIEPSETQPEAGDSEDIGDMDTVIEPSEDDGDEDAAATDADGVEDLDTVIDSDGDSVEEE